MAVQIVFGSVWQRFALEHGSDVITRLANLSRNPFLWNNVIQGLMHASTWPGTALAYRQLIGVIFFEEKPETIICDSTCEYCGSESVFQTIVNAIHTAVNYPRLSGSSQKPAKFIPLFVQFLLDVSLSHSSPFREQLSRVLFTARNQTKGSTCPIALLPTIFEIFNSVEFSEYFFGKLKFFFLPYISNRKPRTSTPTVSSFFLMVLAKSYEGSTVESGRNFDSILLNSVVKFVETLPANVDMYAISSPVSSPRFVFKRPDKCASALIQIIRNSLISMFLPPTEWAAGPTQSNGQPLKIDRLERCTQFMEPSAVLAIIRYMLTRPGAIPNLTGNNEGKFNYVISKVNVTKFDLDRCVCLIKSVKTSSPAESPGPLTGPQSRGAKLALIVKEVNVQVEHEWRLEWNSKRYGTYYGTNTVTVQGLSSQVSLTLFPDDQGPVIDSATLSLGQVEHSCSILNSNFISEMVAQAALDWFAEPLTKLLQNASQTALDQFLKSAAIDFRIKIWNASILRIVPVEVLTELVSVLNDYLPKHGAPI
jgi:hypothetical protein